MNNNPVNMVDPDGNVALGGDPPAQGPSKAPGNTTGTENHNGDVAKPELAPPGEGYIMREHTVRGNTSKKNTTMEYLRSTIQLYINNMSAKSSYVDNDTDGYPDNFSNYNYPGSEKIEIITGRQFLKQNIVTPAKKILNFIAIHAQAYPHAWQQYRGVEEKDQKVYTTEGVFAEGSPELEKVRDEAQIEVVKQMAILIGIEGLSYIIPVAFTPTIRLEYEAQVQGLSRIVENMKVLKKSPEEIARTVHAMRRGLGIKYKNMTPEPLLEKIYARNIEKYRDPLGPSIEYLRSKGYSWEAIIQKAINPGGKDINFWRY